MHETNNINQDERIRLNELKEASENTPDNKLDLVEYIKYYLMTIVRIISY